jgi:transcriptional regulator with XRE-family HTH domain
MGMAKKTSIAEELRAAIAKAEAKGMTRADIAKAAGMARQMVYRIADGKTIPRLDTAERLALGLNLMLRLVTK